MTDPVTVKSTWVRCTNYCNFQVTGTPEYCQEMYEQHEHQAELEEVEGSHWYEHVFSIWGFFILAVVVGGVVPLLSKLL